MAGGDTTVPTVIWPVIESNALGYDDLQGRFSIEWSGNPSAQYILAYELGEAPFSLAGEMRVTGTVKDFGAIDRHYWETWVLPYQKAHIRVRAEGGGSWSNWQTLVFRK